MFSYIEPAKCFAVLCVCCAAFVSDMGTKYTFIQTPSLSMYEGGCMSTRLVLLPYYTMRRLTVCMQLQLVENMIVFDDSGKQIDGMEESASKVEEDAKRKMFRQHLFIG